MPSCISENVTPLKFFAPAREHWTVLQSSRKLRKLAKIELHLRRDPRFSLPTRLA